MLQIFKIFVLSQKFLGAILLCCIFNQPIFAQVEHISVSHPVYDFFVRAEMLGLTGNFSTSVLPLQRKEIISVLSLLDAQKDKLSQSDALILERFAKEFAILPQQTSSLFTSATDSVQVFFNRLTSEDEKYFYRFHDSLSIVNVAPLASLEYRHEKGVFDSSAVLGQAGIRLYGTIRNNFGYSLQITNGSILYGARSIGADDPIIRRSVKFSAYNSDFDFTDSHLHFDSDWFFASVGRENRLIGAGFFNHLYTSNNAPPYDALTLGARFSNFEYRFMHASLIGISINNSTNGVSTDIPQKYVVIHRFNLKEKWGEIGINESVIYSDRSVELAYLNPLSFLKSIEHSLHDRDNSSLGFDGVFRIANGLEIKGSFLLDDLIFSKIGTDYWGNKSAWNLGAMLALPFSCDISVEFARVYPYTFSHFNSQNAMTNDDQIFTGNLPPNSDELTTQLHVWFGYRYPLTLGVSYLRHGKNILDANGNIINNVGGDYHVTMRSGDSDNAHFLAGDVERIFSFWVGTGFEVSRGFHFQVTLHLSNVDGNVKNLSKFGFYFGDF